MTFYHEQMVWKLFHCKHTVDKRKFMPFKFTKKYGNVK